MSKSWRNQYRVHPAADLFPMMNDEELDDLAADIKKNGLATPVTFWTDNREYTETHAPEMSAEVGDSQVYLLDGRNRMDAIYRAGFTLKNVPTQSSPSRREVYTKAVTVVSNDSGDSWQWRGDVDPVAYVMALNLKRRHLNLTQRKALAKKLLKLTPARSDRQVAKDVGVSHTTVAGVRDEMESTGQIGQLTKRTGADGKTRKQPATKPKTEAKPETVVRRLVRGIEKSHASTIQTLWALKPNDEARNALAEYRDELAAFLADIDAILSGAAAATNGGAK